MRRNYISPEFEYDKVNGTLSMKDDKTFFCSQLMKTDDIIFIGTDGLSFYQDNLGQQLNINNEKYLPQVTYDTNLSKLSNHTMVLDTSKEDGNWILTIQLDILLKNQLFAILKKYRTFNGIQNIMTLNGSVDSAIYDWIRLNLIQLYKLDKIDFYYRKSDLLEPGNLKYLNVFDSLIVDESNGFKSYNSITDANGLDIIIKFKQPDDVTKFSFKYYFNLTFKK